MKTRLIKSLAIIILVFIMVSFVFLINLARNYQSNDLWNTTNIISQYMRNLNEYTVNMDNLINGGDNHIIYGYLLENSKALEIYSFEGIVHSVVAKNDLPGLSHALTSLSKQITIMTDEEAIYDSNIDSHLKMEILKKYNDNLKGLYTTISGYMYFPDTRSNQANLKSIKDIIRNEKKIIEEIDKLVEINEEHLQSIKILKTR